MYSLNSTFQNILRIYSFRINKLMNLNIELKLNIDAEQKVNWYCNEYSTRTTVILATSGEAL